MPHKVLQHGIILVLAAAVICMQMSSSLPKAVQLKVKQAGDCVGSFSSLDSFNEKNTTFCGNASVITPNTAHFLRVLQKMGPGFIGLDGQ